MHWSRSPVPVLLARFPLSPISVSQFIGQLCQVHTWLLFMANFLLTFGWWHNQVCILNYNAISIFSCSPMFEFAWLLIQVFRVKENLIFKLKTHKIEIVCNPFCNHGRAGVSFTFCAVGSYSFVSVFCIIQWISFHVKKHSTVTVPQKRASVLRVTPQMPRWPVWRLELSASPHGDRDPAAWAAYLQGAGIRSS